MATRDDVRQIALALPEVIEDGDRFAFSLAATGKAKPKSFAWVWLERVDPKKGRVPNPSVLAIQTLDHNWSANPHFSSTAPYPAPRVRFATPPSQPFRE